MKLDLSNPIEVERANKRLEWLIEKQKMINLTEVRKKRSDSQNGYFHLLIGWFALEYGETKEYVKQIMFKRDVNPELFRMKYHNQKQGTERVAWRSTADLDTKEMTIAIEKFRDYSAKEAGIYLPDPENVAYLNHIENELRRYANAKYL